MATTPLIVLDTNVLVAGLCRRTDSPSFKILQNIQKAVVPLVLTKKLYHEYESVLTRKNILTLIGTSKTEIMSVLEALLVLAYQSEVYYMWRPNLQDEEDNFVLEAAVATSALVVIKNTTNFQKGELKFPDLVVLTPQQFCNQYL